MLGLLAVIACNSWLIVLRVWVKAGCSCVASEVRSFASLPEAMMLREGDVV